MSDQVYYFFNWDVIWRNFDKLGYGLLLGLEMAVVSLFIGCIIGLVGGLAGSSPSKLLRWTSRSYVEFIRNIPILLLAYLTYFGLPLLGISFLDNTASFVMALSIYAGAYLTEVFRAGIQAVPVSMVEAGKAIGLRPFQLFWYIKRPIMFRIVLPSLSNNLISLFKDTSMASAIAVPELTWGAVWINVNTFRVVESWVTAALLYLGTCYLIAFGLRRIERRFVVVK